MVFPHYMEHYNVEFDFASRTNLTTQDWIMVFSLLGCIVAGAGLLYVCSTLIAKKVSLEIAMGVIGESSDYIVHEEEEVAEDPEPPSYDWATSLNYGLPSYVEATTQRSL